MLKAGYLGTLTVGFRRDDDWIEPTLKYTARDLAGAAANDDDPGRIRPGANIDGASFYNYLTYSLGMVRPDGDRTRRFQEADALLPDRARPSPGSMAISPRIAPILRAGGRLTGPA